MAQFSARYSPNPNRSVENILQVLLLGLIEGVTEFLPISSTGHLLIAESLGLGHRSELFNIGIQFGAILAVVFIYRAKLMALARDPMAADNKPYLLRLGVAFLVTAVGALTAKKLGLKLPETIAPVAWALLIGGVAILLIERLAARAGEQPLSWRGAVAVGAAQVLAAVFPGTSRSAASIFAAMWAGPASRAQATEFSFLVGIPTMFAATASALKDVAKTPGALAAEDWGSFALGFVVSALVAFVVVQWLLRYIQTHRFTLFAWYRILLGAALLGYVALA